MNEDAPKRGAALHPRRIVVPALLVGTYLVLGVGYLMSVPLFEAPDEPSHLEYVAFLAEAGRLPTYGADPDVPGEGMQPPLYYLLAWPAYAWAHDPAVALRSELHRVNTALYHAKSASDLAAMSKNREIRPVRTGATAGARRFEANPRTARLRGVRVTSLVLGALAVWITWAAALRATGRPAVAGLAAGLLAFNPQFLFVSGTISNDTAAAAVGAGAFALVVAALDGRTRTRRLYVATALVGALALAVKTNTLWPVLVSGVVVWQCDLRPATRRLGDLALASLVFAVLAGPLLVLNTLHRGDPLGSDAIWQSAAHLPRPEHWGGVASWLATRYWHWTFESYWGRFGWFDVPMPRWALAPYVAVTAVGLWGAWCIARGAREREGEREEAGREGEAEAARAVSPRRLVLTLAAVAASAIAAHLWLNVHVAQAQGRHLFAVAPQIAMLLALGWCGVASRRNRAVAPLAIGLTTAMACAAALVLVGVIRVAYG